MDKLLSTIVNRFKRDPKRPGDEKTRKKVETWLSTCGYTPTMRQQIEVALKANPLLQQINWPMFHHLDEWGLLKYQKIILEFCIRFHDRKIFDICPCNELASIACYERVPATVGVYDKLRSIHCVDLNQIPIDMLMQVPAMINYVFSEGRLLNPLDKPVIRNEIT